ncbi:MAG: tetratricopeptide repeat protein [Bacteroidales bacterium]|jgi:tetratricopeptide (TPR) repeat protein|nr:tetratricopeptide repeat protein [Bacteroidales bacterium]
MKQFLNGKTIFWTIAIVALVIMLVASLDAGVSGDEPYHYEDSIKNIEYYATFGKDTSAYALSNYGACVDNIAYGIARVTGLSDSMISVMHLRHLCGTLVGWLGMLFAALAAWRLSNKKYLPAIITFVLLVFSPRFLGHSFNNLKDPTMASFFMMAIYGMIVFLQDFPKVKWQTIVLLIISIGFAIGVRPGGLLLFAYMGLFGLTHFIFVQKGLAKKSPKSSKSPQNLNKSNFKRLLFYGIIVFVGGYIFAVIQWPFLIKHPIDNMIASFKTVSAFPAVLAQLFEGQFYQSSDIPKYYLEKWMVMTIPTAVLLGFVIRLITGWKREDRFWTFMLLFCVFFPLFWIWYTGANVYGGWRHATFVYPPMVALAGLGFNSIIEKARKPVVKYILTALPFVLLLHPALFAVRNHPYEYLYFNELSGGIKNAYGKYELDYYFHSSRACDEWVIKNADTTLGRKVVVACWGGRVDEFIFSQDTAHFKRVFSRYYDRADRDWDYAVFPTQGRGITPAMMKNKKIFPPANAVHLVEVDGIPVGFVLKRTDRNDYYGYRALKAGMMDSAVYYYKKALQADPYNEGALSQLSEIYLQQGKNDSALIHASFLAQNIPDDIQALSLLANIYLQKRDPNSAMIVASNLKKVAPREMQGYWLSAYANLQMNNASYALNDLKKVVELRPDFKQAYQLMAQIYQQSGDNQTAQQLLQYAAQLR